MFLGVGSDHIKSQNNPEIGIYLNLSSLLISSIDFNSVEIPACTQKKELFTIAASGKQSNNPINIS